MTQRAAQSLPRRYDKGASAMGLGCFGSLDNFWPTRDVTCMSRNDVILDADEAELDLRTFYGLQTMRMLRPLECEYVVDDSQYSEIKGRRGTVP